MTPQQKMMLQALVVAVTIAEIDGCKCPKNSPLGDHEQWCHVPRIKVALARTRDYLGVGAENEMGDV